MKVEMKRVIAYGVVLLWMIALGKSIINEEKKESFSVIAKEDENNKIDDYENRKSCIVELTGQYKKEIKEEEVEGLLFQIGKQFQVNTGTISKKEKDNGYEVTFKKDSSNGNIIIRFLSLKQEEIVDNYMIIQIDLKENIGYGRTYQQLLKKIGETYFISGIPTQLISIQYSKKLSLEEKNNIVNDLYQQYNIEEIEGFRGEEFYTLYGYTPYIPYEIENNDTITNVNIAFNNKESGTNLFIGIPVIKNDY